MFMRKLALAATLVAFALPVQAKMMHHGPSLYKRLGGKAAITAVVDDFVGNVAADTRINAFSYRTRLSSFEVHSPLGPAMRVDILVAPNLAPDAVLEPEPGAR